jgi:hypothetical protein
MRLAGHVAVVCELALFQTRALGFSLHFVRGEQGMHERHQERFDGVQFGGIDGVRACEIIDDAPWVAFVVDVIAGFAAQIAHAPHVRMGEPDILSTN